MEQNISDEDRFVYHVDRPDLQELASYRVALSLWYNYLSGSNYGDDPTSLRISVNSVMCYSLDNYRGLNEMVECLKMPQSLEKLLKKSLASVVKETSDWLGELRNLINEVLYDPNWCVWFDDGRIDPKRSALKVLSSNDELSNVKKFAIMSKFCLEDEIVKFSLESLPEDFTSQRIFKNEFLIQYWYYRMKNDVQNVKTSMYMALNCGTQHSFQRWTAFEYFWYHLDANQQTGVANHIIAQKYYSAQFLQRLLGTMVWYQQRRILGKNRTRILCKLASESDSLRAARWTWTHSKGRITFATFVEFVGTIIERRLNDEEWMSWLIEVWDSAPDKYKTEAAKKMKHRFYLGHILNKDYSNSSFKILSTILSLQSVDSRKEMILEQACHFGPHMIDHHSMNEMLRLHLPDPDDKKKFKKLVLESFQMKSACTKLIVFANFDRLNMLLEFYLDTPNDAQLFKKKFLESKFFTSEYVTFYMGHWNGVSKFIAEDLYPGNAPLILEKKKQLICLIFDSYFHFNYDCEDPWAPEVTELIQTVDSEFAEHDVNDLKRTLWSSVQLILKNYNGSDWYEAFFKEKRFLRFVKWCFGDGDRVVLDFEDGRFVDRIFSGVFSVLYKKYSPRRPEKTRPKFEESLLTDLEEYLSWCFVSREEMNNYIRGKINSCSFRIMSAVEEREDESSLRKLLNWFFQYDESAILEYRSSRFSYHCPYYLGGNGWTITFK